ncbi:FtsW/RodA/SpoVE family cell cycle protein [Rubritalea tangerina]|uniref:Probable peptidoglycan glycosyltransferase FtsW n=1 Tax=Rubritalea tangerina TaxID=430798 RepID=A0ABW4ZCL5_9BACT
MNNVLERSIDSRNAIVVCLATCLLMVLGLVMLASTSVWIAEGAEYSLLIKQIIFLLFGLCVAGGLAYSDYRKLRKYAWPIYGFALFLLALCYVPGIGKEVNGETRWIQLAGFTFQPSEPAKIALMVALAAWFAHHQAEVRTFKRGFVMPMVIMGVLIGLIFFEKDMGTAAGLAAAAIGLMYIAGTRGWLLVTSCLGGLGVLSAFVYTNPNRMARILAFLNPDDPEAQRGFFFQQYRGLLAWGNGGIDGLGLGNGAEKHGYLPFAHTDFIFPMVGEELGLWFALGTVFCFALIASYGIAIAARSTDLFGRLLAAGLTCSIVIPAMMNMGVTTAVLPNTGLPLPFVSYGGTNLVFTLATIGLLVSIHRSTITISPRGEKVLLGKKKSVKL